MSINRRQVLALTAGSALGAATPLLHAQSAWPSKPIRFVVPFAPGGTSEIVARSVAAELSKQLGHNVYVENKPGGAGVTAMSDVAKAPPVRPKPQTQDQLLGLFSAEVTGRDFKMEPATLFDMVGKTEVIKPSLEVVYDNA